MGHWRAPRGHIGDCGDTSHCGIDLIADYDLVERKGQNIIAPMSGVVSLGLQGDASKTCPNCNAVFIKKWVGQDEFKFKILYTKPIAIEGQEVIGGETLIGQMQNLRDEKLFPDYGGPNGGMTNHTHVLLKINGNATDPTPYNGEIIQE